MANDEERRAGIAQDGDDILDYMHPKQYDLTTRSMQARAAQQGKQHDPRILEACRLIMVPAEGKKKGRGVTEIAQEYGIHQSQLSAKCSDIWEHWAQLEKEGNYASAFLIFDAKTMAVLKAQQEVQLDQLAELILPPSERQ